MDNNKYYTPNHSEITLDYECEIAPLYKDEWTKIKIRSHEDMYNMFLGIYNKQIRVPFLTHKDIISEGWEKKEDKDYLSKGEYRLIYGIIVKDDNTSIHYLNVVLGKTSLFAGKCKSINDFRKIMKYLMIQA